MLYDSFLLFGLLMLYGYLTVFIEGLLLGQAAIEHSPTAGGNWLVFIGMLIVVAGFYCLFWLKSGQTLGMQAWRLQLKTLDGTPLTLRHCILRLGIGFISIALLGLGYWWCLLPGKQTWHDRFSHTRMTVHPKV